MKPDKYISVEDLMALQSQLGPPDSGGPKGPEFQGIKPKPYRMPEGSMWQDYQEGNPSPRMGLLEWLLRKLQGGMWGSPDYPDELQDMWLKQQMERPQLPRIRT